MGARKVQVLSSNGVVCQHLLWGACWQNLGLVKLWLGCQGQSLRVLGLPAAL